MGLLTPGHFSITPEALLDHRTVAGTTIRSDSDGQQVTVEFSATLRMELSAFEQLVKSHFKGVYWLGRDPAQP